MAEKRASLATFTTAKGNKATPPAPIDPEATPARRGQTLRLAPEAWRELKILAIDQGKPVHALLIEAINDVLRKHGRPAIAS